MPLAGFKRKRTDWIEPYGLRIKRRKLSLDADLQPPAPPRPCSFGSGPAFVPRLTEVTDCHAIIVDDSTDDEACELSSVCSGSGQTCVATDADGDLFGSARLRDLFYADLNGLAITAKEAPIQAVAPPTAPSPTPVSNIGSLLPLPLSLSRTVTPQQRVLARGADPATALMQAQPDGKAPKTAESSVQVKKKYTADPGKLPAIPRSRYYGVRQGRTPGIYYILPDAKKQIKGCPAIMEAFKSVEEVEHYMNHEPDECCFSSCAKLCKEAVGGAKQQPKKTSKAAAAANAAKQQTQKTPNPEPAATHPCELCGGQTAESSVLCPACFKTPEVWLNTVIEKHSLASEQAAVLRTAAEGENVFFTGAAGTGKSKVIHAMQEYLQGLNANVQLIAHSGIAALNIGGRTMCSFAGWDPSADRASITELCQRAGRGHAKKRFTGTDILIIDEISMVASDALTRLSQIMQSVAPDGPNKSMPFGGVQVIISGDFYQLPPVKPMEYCVLCGGVMIPCHSGWHKCREHGDFNWEERYAFSSPAWGACALKMFELTQVHRQDDADFISILTVMRKGLRLTNQEEDVLYHHAVDITRDDATKLVPLKDAARQINAYHVGKIPHPSIDIHAFDDFKWNQALHPDLGFLGARENDKAKSLAALRDQRICVTLEMKLDMLVLLVSNVCPDKGLVNGSIGRIVGFVDITDDNTPKAPVKNDKEKNKKKKGKAPILHGEHAEYEAAQIRSFIDRLPNNARKWPIVEFKNGVKEVVYACCRVTGRGHCRPFSLLSRTQIPLLPGYALTIHASQGMTLDSVVVDLERCWERGQAYVALSRARSLQGLIVDALPRRHTPTDPVVEDFMRDNFPREPEGGGPAPLGSR